MRSQKDKMDKKIQQEYQKWQQEILLPATQKYPERKEKPYYSDTKICRTSGQNGEVGNKRFADAGQGCLYRKSE